MNEFQFNCPKCRQNILATAKWTGRRMTCPSCETRIIIPAPSAALKKSGKRPVGIEAPPLVGIRVKLPPKSGGGSTIPPSPKKGRPSIGPMPVAPPAFKPAKRKAVNDA